MGVLFHSHFPRAHDGLFLVCSITHQHHAQKGGPAAPPNRRRARQRWRARATRWRGGRELCPRHTRTQKKRYAGDTLHQKRDDIWTCHTLLKCGCQKEIALLLFWASACCVFFSLNCALEGGGFALLLRPNICLFLPLVVSRQKKTTTQPLLWRQARDDRSTPSLKARPP